MTEFKEVLLETTGEIDDTDAIRLLNVVFNGGTFSTWLNPDGPGIVVRGDSEEIEKLANKHGTLLKLGIVVAERRQDEHEG